MGSRRWVGRGMCVLYVFLQALPHASQATFKEQVDNLSCNIRADAKDILNEGLVIVPVTAAAGSEVRHECVVRVCGGRCM